MTLMNTIRAIKISVFATALATAQQVQANDPPQIAVDGVENGVLSFNGPVQISGIAGDPDGIAVMYGTIHNPSNKLFLATDGSYSKEPVRQQFEFAKNLARTTWAAPTYQLPEGDYVFRMRAVDGKKRRTKVIEIPVRVTGTVAIATAVDAQAKQVAATAAAPVKTMAANGMPYCSKPELDTDKDGYGWENETSCIVADSKADKNPTCASATSDPDGDGWGWENEQSCIVVTHCKTADSDPDGDGWGWENEKPCIVVKTAGKHPTYASAKSDPDGDGYGWENNATCLIAK